MLRRRAFLLAAFVALAAPAAAQPSSTPSQDDRGRTLTSAESYVPVPTLSTGVIGRYSTSGTLVVDVGLDIPDSTLRTRAGALGPRLRDALRTALSTYANTYYRDGAAPDPVVLTRLMQAAVDRTLGRAGARLLLANLIYQPRR